jgi:CRP/FNR family transcriptional regulator, cyclic AMP receptor protein
MPPKRFDPAPFFQHVGEGKKITEYKAGQTIFKQGGRGDCVFYIVSGSVRESARTHAGREGILELLEPGEFFGLESLEGTSHRTRGAIAVKPSRIMVITTPVMRHEMLTNPALMGKFFDYILDRAERFETEKLDLLFCSIEQRLARRLLTLGHSDGTSAADVIGPEITQEMLANMIGTTRPRVNHFMQKFRKLGLIQGNGFIVVDAPKLFEAVLGDPGK